MIRIQRLPDGTFEAVAEVTVGVQTRTVRVPVGSDPRPVDPAGLRNTPVVVFTDPSSEPVIREGIANAGGASVRLAQGEPLGAALLADAGKTEVLLVLAEGPAEGGSALRIARALAGRPLPVVPFDDLAAAASLFGMCELDVDVALPSIGSEARAAARAAAERLGLFDEHHVVEVDPRPALGDPADLTTRPLSELAAAVTGVLAARIAAGNRRWRS
jgi:hypothetical protein